VAARAATRGTQRHDQLVRKYRYVVEDHDRHGNDRVYLRTPGKRKSRLWQEPGTPEFDAEYRRAIAGEIKPKTLPRPAAPASGSLRALCISYFGCAESKRMEPRSRHVRRLILDKLCDVHGDKPVALMEPRHVRRIRDEKAELPEAANAIVKALRAVFRHGVQSELLTRNPAREVEYLRAGGDGYHTWTIEEVEQCYRPQVPEGSATLHHRRAAARNGRSGDGATHRTNRAESVPP
jgi:hypothetical protein